MEVIGGCDAVPKSMFVGGCVRNALLEGAVTDVDIATQFAPEAVMEKLKAAGIKVIPTGIDHGTVTAVVNGTPFEITTLRQDVETDGRHAEVIFTEDWVQDAQRRDFTMNTLFADMSGNIYDPIETGIKDLQDRRVVFVGDPATRIAEDYLRILRFFRFHAVYGGGAPDVEALAACKGAADQISTLSRERITQEFLKILAVPDCFITLKIMFDHNVLSEIFDKDYQLGMLQNLCELQEEFGAVDIMARLFVLAGYKARFFDRCLRLSHAQKKLIVKMDMAVRSVSYDNERALKKAIFHHGNQLLLQGYLLMIARGDAQKDRGMIEMVTNWQAPECPISGKDLITEGYQTGPELGQELERRQEEWLEEVI